MLTLEGIYENGKIELLESPPNGIDKVKVLITFVESREINFQERGINTEQAADLRGRLRTLADDWNAPEMDIYDVD